jgi:hypothetical protein
LRRHTARVLIIDEADAIVTTAEGAEKRSYIGPIRNKAASHSLARVSVDCWEPIARRHFNDDAVIGEGKAIRQHDQPIVRSACKGFDSGSTGLG